LSVRTEIDVTDAETKLEVREEEVLDRATMLAIDRTRVAYERTMLAWIRTAASLITFGFAVSKFFEIERPDLQPGWHLFGPRSFGLILVCVGLGSLVLAVLEQRQGLRDLGALYRGKRRSMAVIVAAVVAILGIFALLAVIFRA
jgi:putative membrane protein